MGKQLLPLLKKNFKQNVVRSRRTFLFNVLFPTVFILALIGLRGLVKSNVGDAQHFPAIPLPKMDEMYWDGVGEPRFDIEDWHRFGSSNMFLQCKSGASIDKIKEKFKEKCSLLKLGISTKDQATDEVKQFANEFNAHLRTKFTLLAEKDLTEVFSTEQKMVDLIQSDDYDLGKEGYVGGAVVFDTISMDSLTFDYRLRFNSTFTNTQGIPATNSPIQKMDTNRMTSDFTGKYRISGFLSLQTEIDQFIALKIKEKNGSTENIDNFGADATELFPLRPFNDDGFWSSLKSLIGLFTILSITKPMTGILKDLVGEKESKMRETLFIMNTTRFAYRWSWLLLFTFQMVCTATAMTVVSSMGLATNSDPTLMFVVYFLFLMSCTVFIYFISIFFGRTKTASFVGMTLFLASHFPGMTFNTPSYDLGLKNTMSLFPASAIAFTFSGISDLEGGQIGARWSNMSTESGSGYTVANGLFMMALDIVIYLLLGIYFENILAPAGGVSKKWYYCLVPSFCKRRNKTIGNTIDEKTHLLTSVDGGDDDTGYDNSSHFQEVPDILKAQDRNGDSCRTVNLRREFKTNVGTKVAVKNLNLSFYNGQITALLGHNGAGKTTTISMLTGLIGMTSGDAYIGDLSLSEDMDEIRKSVGICPQHNVLFPNLSVKEHLDLFANIKGVPSKDINRVVKNMIADVGLVEKTDEASASLSGGMKRKLHLAIALIGDSKYIFLDEPTSGMDPYSRRFTWDTIAKHKKDRVIVLTTHFMDEAEILADRIAIMSGGELKCVGSSLFLKQIYGVGYTMTLVKQHNSNKNCEVRSFDSIEFVKKYIPSAEVISDVGAELSFRLSLDSAEVFETMLTDLDSKKDELHIDTYGVSVTTLEEVFLRIAKGTEDIKIEDVQKTKELRRQQSKTVSFDDDDDQYEHEHEHEDTIDRKESFGDESLINNNNKISRIEDMSGFMVAFTHFKALWCKRWHIYKRDKKSWCLQFALPLGFLIVGMLLLQARPSISEPSMLLNIENSNLNSPMPLAYGQTPLNDKFIPTWNDMHLSPADGVKTKLSGKFPRGGTKEELEAFEEANKEFSVWLVDHVTDYKESRYAAIQSTTLDGGFTIFANSTSFHAAPIASNIYSTGFLTNLAKERVTLNVYNHPLPPTQHQKTNFGAQNAFSAAIYVTMSLAFVPASFVYFVVHERECKAKHQQLLSGVSSLAYWGCTWVWDTINNLVPNALMILIIYLFQIDEFTGTTEAFSATCLVIFVFGLSVAPFTYLMSWMFKSPSTAQTVMTTLNFVSGLILLIIDFVLLLLAYDTERWMVYIFRVFPMFCIGNSLLLISSVKTLYQKPNASLFEMGICGWNIVYLLVGSLIYFLLTMLVEQMMSNPNARKFLTREPHVPLKPEALDQDVEAERERVATLDKTNKDTSSIYIRGLRKVFSTLKGGAKVAVKDIHLAIPNGECFGLLGVNGAGKTTTMSMMTGDFPPSAGEAYLGGVNILAEPQKARRLVGYCPQFDALFDRMTAYEHLQFYARLKGVHRSIRKQVIEDKLKQMKLTEFRDKQSRGYSGGNKRKLSVAMALIGDPKLLFLDEPSTGVDPLSRHFMWEVISEVATHSSVVLTTHSMEECEALCSRIGIMVGGNLRCLGNAQHLKNRFGLGFQLELSLKPSNDDEIMELEHEMRKASKMFDTSKSSHDGNVFVDLDELKHVLTCCGASEFVQHVKDGASGASLYFSALSESGVGLNVVASWLKLERTISEVFKAVNTNFPNSVLKERQGYTLRFEVPKQSITLPQMFGRVSQINKEHPIDSYSLSQTTLEQIFNRFASEQEEEQGHAAGLM